MSAAEREPRLRVASSPRHKRPIPVPVGGSEVFRSHRNAIHGTGSHIDCRPQPSRKPCRDPGRFVQRDSRAESRVSPMDLALAERGITLDPTATTTRVRVCTSVGAAVRVTFRRVVYTTPSPHDSVEQGEARENIQAAFGACPRRDTSEPHGLRRGLWRGRRRRWRLG
jgi:hypothetical protein